jgi:Fe-S oxidoreductase
MGGCGWVVTIHRADELRYKAFEIKMRQIKAAGAARLASSCSNCRQTSDDGQARFRWDRKTESLFELVAENLGT